MIVLDAPMTGDGCRAEAWTEAWREPLKAACAEDLEIWSIYATNFGPESFDESFDKVIALPWARFVLFEDDELAGMSCFLHIDEARGVLEVGNTYYRPKYRGTGFNRRVKDMMLRRAFDCGYRRVEFRVDARNKRSQAAMTKLGAVREGVMRADRITWNGHVRDTVLFSILNDEWGKA
jgi:RimJ/RimL family protein N-acetyltransferase